VNVSLHSSEQMTKVNPLMSGHTVITVSGPESVGVGEVVPAHGEC
jgi:hypothetical protein